MADLIITQPSAPGGAGETSLDLAEAHGAVRLIQAALQSAAEAPLPADAPATETDEGPINPRTLLTVLIYAMARGVFDVEELETRLRSDPDLRYVCAHRFPDSNALRHFRRRHWRLLESALAGLIQRSAPEPGSPYAIPGEAESEARRRLRLSVWTDTVA